MNVPYRAFQGPGGPTWSSAVYPKGQPLSSPHAPLPHQQQQQPPQLVQANLEINALVDLYQQQLVELNAAHSLLMEDQERLARMVSPYVDEAGRAQAPIDEDVLFFKRGLDLRLMEFDEDCRRIKITEQTLQRRLDDLALGYDAMVMEAHGFAESKLMHQVNDLRKVVGLLQLEMDEIRFQRDIFADEAKRLRGVCRYGDWIQDGFAAPLQPHEVTPRTLHRTFRGTPASLPHTMRRKTQEDVSPSRKSKREETEAEAEALKSVWPSTRGWSGFISNLFGDPASDKTAGGKSEKQRSDKATRKAAETKRGPVSVSVGPKYISAPSGPPPRKPTSKSKHGHPADGSFSQPVPRLSAVAELRREKDDVVPSHEVRAKIVFSKADSQSSIEKVPSINEERGGRSLARGRSDSLYTPSRYGSSLLSVGDRESEPASQFGSTSESESSPLESHRGVQAEVFAVSPRGGQRLSERIPLRRRHHDVHGKETFTFTASEVAGPAEAARRLSQRLKRTPSRTVPPPEGSTPGSLSPHSISRERSAAFLGSVEEASHAGTPRSVHTGQGHLRRGDSLRSDPGAAATLRVATSPRRRGYSSEEFH